MAASPKQRVTLQQLRTFTPISQLTADNLHDLADKTHVESLGSGRLLFRSGAEDNFSYYLISGELALKSDDGETIIKGGSAQAKFALDHNRPRQATAVAKSKIQYIRIDNDFLDILLTWDQSGSYLVSEIDEENGSSGNGGQGNETDWMTNILRSELFRQIPPANIQAMFVRMVAVPVNAGDVIIRQGDDGDFYYYISRGRCLITRNTGDRTVKLAELAAGSSFGEEALVSGAKRNANVSMITDGVLMRLGKSDFEALLKAPVVKGATFGTAKEMVKDGAVWLDVRLENEHQNWHIPRSRNIPLYLLRLKAQELDKNTPYVVYCDTGRRSASAAYLLSERGIDCHVLSGGLMALKQQQSKAE